MTGTSLGERLQARVARLRAALAEVEGELAERRFHASSGAVTAVVDHRARVVELRFTGVTLARVRAGELGQQVVEAVSRAQREALATTDELMTARLEALR